MSLGRSRGCSRASTIYRAQPFWNSRTKALQGMGTPSTSNRGLHVRCVTCSSALFCFSWLSTNWDLLSRASWITVCCFVPFWGLTLPYLSISNGIFFFKSGLGFKLRSVGICGGERGTWDSGVAFDVDYLPLAAMSSFKLLLPLFNTILSSSSSEELSGGAITRIGVWTPEFLSDSPSAFEMLIRGALGLFSSLKWNLSISSSNDKRDEAISSSSIATASGRICRSGSATSGRFYGTGSTTRGKSLWAKNPGLETSIRANLEFPTLIAWPTSWKIRGRGL